MKIHKACKIELVTCQDATRYILANAYLDGANLVATDGRRLVVLPIERDGEDHDGPVSAEALAMGRKLTKKGTPVSIGANGGLTLANGTKLPRPDLQGINYPNWKQVLPKDTPERKSIAFDARYLWEMAQAMGCDAVRISILDDRSAIIVKPCGKTEGPADAMGVLMPVRVD